MKRLTFILLAIFLVLSNASFSQTHLLTSQEEVDNIGSTLVGSIGVLEIKTGSTGTPIHDLSPLIGVTETFGLLIEGNPDLVSLTGLENLTQVLGPLSLVNNSSLIDLTALSNVTSSLTLVIHENFSLTSLEGLHSIQNVVVGVSLRNNWELSSLIGLRGIREAGSISIDNNDKLVTLTGLENLSLAIPGGRFIRIRFNASLIDISSLSNLSFVQNITIRENHMLCDCEAVLTMDDYMLGTDIANNKTGCNSLQEILDGIGCSFPCDEEYFIDMCPGDFDCDLCEDEWGYICVMGYLPPDGTPELLHNINPNYEISWLEPDHIACDAWSVGCGQCVEVSLDDVGTTFTAKVVDLNGCAQIIEYTITCETGLEEDEIDERSSIPQESISLYPNPASTMLHVENPNGQDLEIEIYNANGVKVLTDKSTSENVNTVDINSLQSGLYMVLIKDELSQRFLLNEKLMILD